MTDLHDIAQVTYLVELVVIGLLAIGLAGILLALIFRKWSGKQEHKEILNLRQSAEEDSGLIHQKIETITTIEKDFHEKMAAAKIQLDTIEDEQNIMVERAQEIERRAERLAQLESKTQQSLDALTERLNQIQGHWDQQLTDTVQAVNQINNRLDEGLQRTLNQEKQISKLFEELTTKYEHAGETASSAELQKQIQSNLENSLSESEKFLEQLREHQQKASTSLARFNDELGGYETQAIEQFDAFFNSADVARQEMNANLDESRSYVEQLRNDYEEPTPAVTPQPPQQEEEPVYKELVVEGIEKVDPPPLNNSPGKKTKKKKKDKAPIDRKERPIINMESAEDLTDPSLIKKYGGYTDDKNLISLFSKIRKHGS